MFRRFFIAIFLLTIANFVFAADFTVQKLSNGQTLIIQEIKNNPIVTIYTWVKTGSINENDTNSGVANFFVKDSNLDPLPPANNIAIISFFAIM